MDLSLEFNRYLNTHPEAFKKIPHKANIVLTIKGDDEFNRSSLNILEKGKRSRQKYIEARKVGRRWFLQPA